VRIRILGGMEIESSAGEPLRLPTRKTSLLLAALVLAANKGVRREGLCEAFWADSGQAQARSSLRQALAAIRRLFASQDLRFRLDGDLETVGLVARPEDVDVRLFDSLMEKAGPRHLAEAADCYQGDLLAGIVLPEPLDQWFAPHQRIYRRKALQLVERLSLLPTPDLDAIEPACRSLAERLLSADPAAEEAHRALIRLHRHAGRVNAALRQFQLCKEALRRELGVDPEARTSELLADQRQQVARAVAATPPRDRDQPSAIVMPFDNLSGSSDDYFVDGVVEEITAALSRMREFFVIARQSAFTFKGRFVDVREVGRDLGVEYVVQGTVRRAGDRLRISVQLVDAETRAQLWSDRYDGSVTDVFEFQDQIATQVAGAIHPAVRKAEIDAARRKPPDSLRAYDLVLQAYPRIWSQDCRDNSHAIALLGNAIASDPHYGRAHALLALCLSRDVVYLWSPDPETSRQRARAAVDAASALVTDDPTALAAVGAAISHCLDDLPRAASCIEGALALDPNNAWAWARYAWLATYQDEPDQARERFERSLALSPLDPLAYDLHMGIALALSLKGAYAQAANVIQEVLNKHPQATWAYRQLAYVCARAGDMPAARMAIQRLLAAHPHASIALLRKYHPVRHIPRVFDEMLEGWRLAGLPEK
jgi:TolB-like protein/Tfp pilus assembly protein PilF